MTILQLDWVATPRQGSMIIRARTVSADEAADARVPADMVGNLVAKVATGCRAEPGDLYAATRMAWSDGRLAPGSASDPRAAPSAGQAVRAGDRRGYRSPGLDQVPAAPLPPVASVPGAPGRR